MINITQGFVVRPGHENLVAMGAISTKADPDIIGQWQIYFMNKGKYNCQFDENIYPLIQIFRKVDPDIIG